LPNTKPIITYSPDQSVSSSIIAGMAEKFMYVSPDSSGKTPLHHSNLKIIYITSTSHLQKNITELNLESTSNSIISNLMCETNINYTHHNLIAEPNQFILIGVDENTIDEYELGELSNSTIPFFTIDNINRNGLDKIIKMINTICLDYPTHIVFDMSVMDVSVSQCVTRSDFYEKNCENKQSNGLSLDKLDAILNACKNLNVVSLDVTGYNLKYVENDIGYRLTCETARRPLLKLFNFKEKSINIFNEQTRFLIWRPLHQTSDKDVGWFILKGMSLIEREEILENLGNDIIQSIPIDNNNGTISQIYITSTTMALQEQKVYLAAQNLSDCTLFPEEKINMAFELLNTNDNFCNKINKLIN